MSRRHFLFVIGACALPPKMAVGSKFASPSAALGTLRAAINDQGSKLIEITPDQWKFLLPRRRAACRMGTTPFWRKTAATPTVCCFSWTATGCAHRCTRRPHCSRSWSGSRWPITGVGVELQTFIVWAVQMPDLDNDRSCATVA